MAFTDIFKSMNSRILPFVLLLALGAAACGGGATSAVPAPAPAPVSASVPSAPVRRAAPPPLPAVPLVDGPLAIRVEYPSANQVITSRDSNFILGSIGSGNASLTINGFPARVYPNGAFMGWLPNPPALQPSYQLVAVRGADTARSTLGIRYPAPRVVPPLPEKKPENLATSRADTIAALHGRIDSLRTQLTRNDPVGLVMLGSPSPANDTDVTIVGRPTPGGTYKWFFTPGTVLPLISREGNFARVRLDSDLDVFVDASDAHVLPPDATMPRRGVSNIRVRKSADGADVVVQTGARTPYFVEEGDHSLRVTLYGVHASTDLINYASADSMVRTVEWQEVANDRAVVTINLRDQPYGYLVLFDNNAMVVKLRHKPAIDPARPLAGLTIAVDPGHPPVGATGPTGLYEPQATLPIGERLKRILEERGATVFMTRTTAAPVPLEARPVMARKANVHAFVSIHLNAYGDGVNPFLHPGSGTYFFRTHSEPLAREAQAGMVAQIGLEDLGVNYDNLAVVRGTWYPAILCEGAFIILPDQEAALRTPEFQERYARGVADGIENYFRKLR